MAVLLGAVIKKPSGAFEKGDIYKGLVVFTEIGGYSNKEDAKKVAKQNNDFFKKTNQPLIAKAISYTKKIGDRKIVIDKVVAFHKK